MTVTAPSISHPAEATSRPAPQIGLIVNPIAGLGGPAGLKGSDAADIRERTAGRAGAAPSRAAHALDALGQMDGGARLLTAAGAMGADVAAGRGWDMTVVGDVVSGTTSARDTQAVASELVAAGVDLILFAGGDGTAVDIMEVVGERIPVLGIPAGVKMHSGVFAVSPPVAGRIARRFLGNGGAPAVAAEVVDVDEDALQSGVLSPRLRGVMRVPSARELVQQAKLRSPASEAADIAAAARGAVAELLDGVTYVIGPGSTTGAVLAELGHEHTLLGVDVLRGNERIAVDVSDEELERVLGAGPVAIVVSPIGGQGFIFGRGNQQISPAVIRRAGIDRLMIVATKRKLASLHGRPLMVDTGDEALDATIAGFRHVRVILDPKAIAWYPVAVAGAAGLT